MAHNYTLNECSTSGVFAVSLSNSTNQAKLSLRFKNDWLDGNVSSTCSSAHDWIHSAVHAHVLGKYVNSTLWRWEQKRKVILVDCD